MDPEQNNQDTPPSNLGASSGSPASGPPDLVPAPTVGSGRGSKRVWLWIVIVILVLAALFFAWWNHKGGTDPTYDTAPSTETVVESEVCEEGLMAYENAELDVAFCYPASWGEVAVTDARFQQTTATVDGTTIAADIGQRWRLSFSEKPAVNLGLVSADWTTEVGRDGTCVDPAVQILPPFAPFSTAWTTEGTPISSASRGIEVVVGQSLIQEHVDDLLANGVCISGYTIIDAEDFTHSTATYSAEFSGAVTTPAQHVASPFTLVPEPDREQFYAFVRSIHAIE